VSGNRYYVTDRNNAAVDVFDTGTNQQVGQIKGTGANAFAGSRTTNGSVDNSISGPNGINMVGNLLYVGDVNSVKIIDPSTQQVIKVIQVGTSGKRADEACVDATHNLYMIATPEADTPYLTLINTNTQSIVGTVMFTDASGAPSAGLEACQYDAAGDTFYINNDGTTANPHGEFVAMPGAAIRAIPTGGSANYTDLAGVRMYNEGNCDPTGLALGPGNEVAVGCREATTGAPLLVQIMDRTNGRILASVNAGGGDQMEYDAATNRYYNAASRWTASGKASTNGSCSAASPCTPVLSIIDAATHAVVAKLATGNNAHSVAVDSATSKAFMPISSATAPAGCATCTTEGAGLLIFATK
jgi:YVTN family beta-propeller protein